MLRYFTLRPTNRGADAERRKWLDSELQAGRLRQGWLDKVGLVDAHARLVPRNLWIKQARAAIRKWDWPRPAQMKRYRSANFCPEKYDELRLMTEVQEADVIVVLGLFEKRDNREGFKIAIAKRAPSRKARRRNCYWYEANGGHILSVDSVTPEPRYDFVWEKYAKPF